MLIQDVYFYLKNSAIINCTAYKGGGVYITNSTLAASLSTSTARRLISAENGEGKNSRALTTVTLEKTNYIQDSLF